MTLVLDFKEYDSSELEPQPTGWVSVIVLCVQNGESLPIQKAEADSYLKRIV